MVYFTTLAANPDPFAVKAPRVAAFGFEPTFVKNTSTPMQPVVWVHGRHEHDLSFPDVWRVVASEETKTKVFGFNAVTWQSISHD